LRDIEILVSHPIPHAQAFSPVGGPTMPSADFCMSLNAVHTASCPVGDTQTSPGNARSPSRLCPPRLRPHVPCSYWTLKIIAFSSRMNASYAIPVRRASDLPAASFRFHLAMDTLAVRLTIPAAGLVEDLHLQVNAPCRAHIEKAAFRSEL